MEIIKEIKLIKVEKNIVFEKEIKYYAVCEFEKAKD
jgi:hypothetical protein